MTEERQCERHGPCVTQEPYAETIQAGGILCGGCGRRRGNTRYVLASTVDSLRKEMEGLVENWRRRNSDPPFDYDTCADDLDRILKGKEDGNGS